jgi:glycosyltransferase involved in cell wall biosynthesis
MALGSVKRYPGDRGKTMNNSSPLIVVEALGIDQPGGGRTAVLYLFNALIEMRPDLRFLIFTSQSEPLLSNSSNVQQVVLPARKGILARVLVQILMPLVVLIYKVDLVHFTKSQGAFLIGTKKVLTLFDMTTLRHPEIHSKMAVFIWRYIQPLMARHVDAVMTISKDAARDIQNLLNIPEKKVHVVYCAGQFSPHDQTSKADFQSVREKYSLPSKYMLFIGILALKKNLETLIRSLRILSRDRTEFPTLVMVGPRYRISDAGKIFDLIEQLDLTNKVIYTGPVEPHELETILRRAELFLMPSVHEGFGIPCLESMTCSVPLIASKTSAVTEIVGNAGVLVEEYMSPQAWANSINDLLNNPIKRKSYAERGLERSKEFTWQKSAQTLSDLYDRLLSMGNNRQ